MSKLYFYYGTVCSSKTMNLLAVHKNYELQGRKALLIKPLTDTRSNSIESRSGLKAYPDIIIDNNGSILENIKNYLNDKQKTLTTIPEILLKTIDAVIVDECQFLSKEQLFELRHLSIGVNVEFTNLTKKQFSYIKSINISNFDDFKSNTIKYELPVLCYGLRTKSDGNLWDASSILMAQSDELHEIKTVCSFCNKRAVFSAINPENDNTISGDINPSWNSYIPVCPEHYFSLQRKETSLCKD